ncbi:peptidylprolyl isomerase [Sphaerisporangium krabiense]|uniref:Peptidyl-prolyl cis-trans isomerase n=1 Tax=Sphaerisporangium krabiense TaxID=763782 RepID=A0A7W9DTJ1_9ACTN|nr:peptidylprolyl isomerase [Sphaerisporangium krabiense]MBB5630877.1 peptidyl-prolyl cis-trans isomerase B (cyclophilin B) [Sphaerisporangium krabiense]GII65439.1 peptidylprolyl isomerase [Sphaerisporangium krabiense]
MTTGKDRQKQLAREHYERQTQRRVERQARQKRVAIIGTSLGVLVVVGGIFAAVALVGGGDSKTEAATTPSASAPPSEGPSPKPYDAATGTCDYVADSSGGPAKNVGMPPAKADTSLEKMTLQTNHGDIVIDLATAKAPCTANSFAFLAKQKYFDGSKCHRMGEAAFPMIQCGDPLAKADGKSATDGQGGPGYRFADENLTGAQYKRGVVAMANSGPGTNGSQFFIIFGDLQLPPNYTPFGTVTKGLEILDDVSKKGVLSGGMGDGTGAPKDPVEIKHVTISGKS